MLTDTPYVAGITSTMRGNASSSASPPGRRFQSMRFTPRWAATAVL